MNTTTAKIAIVTGGGSGLGLAIALKFVQQNIRTIITGRNEDKLNHAAKELGDLCIPLPFDMNDLSLIPQKVKYIQETYGTIDVLVNNAGINLKKDLIDVTDEEFQNILQTNVLGVFAISREVAKIMSTQSHGSIINISSMASQYGIPKVIAYTASKSAIEGMTRAMAVELSPAGIRVNCIAPGFIATKMSATALNNDPERKDRVLKRTPMGKLGIPEDIANTAFFLASDASAFITGTVIPVDGGNSIGF
ncbi:SDR family NAD(P)-dependent oxidoreductase [Ohtaekwangia koreensis]|uniref:NAD(P)-dependent dehydrogenase, short-chain alcohol dehydrogenase family n=1 Tax=Ohtaekwangia koreensis TaxID=688867 RepID=A0A1T5MMW4_9BACT|nr:SDR family oxidoreductase [Ohtaekwangia koreensis]SKC89570.1 NAD(P)-dependent dehydrogenase, short-chain alcohol dehydrogenase family [Ohtaekwangia koreensis]